MPASTLADLIRDMESDDMGVRLVSIYELEKYGDKAVLAVPALRSNLYVDDFEVQIAAAIALKHLGPNASSAIPDLIYTLHNASYIHTRAEAADALGFVGDRVVVPDLAIGLFEENSYQSDDVAIPCAESIARITGEKFTDSDSTTGYRIDKNGVTFLVIEAREWWLKTGQYQDWNDN
jgi:HEAT repeat protein